MSSPILDPRSIDFLEAFLERLIGALAACNAVDEFGRGGTPKFGDFDPDKSFDVLVCFAGLDLFWRHSVIADEDGAFCFIDFPKSSFILSFDSLLVDDFRVSDSIDVSPRLLYLL